MSPSRFFPAEFAADPQLKQRLEREAKTISALSHPHICTLYDIGHEGGSDYLVMELLEGETLADRLAVGAMSAAKGPGDLMLKRSSGTGSEELLFATPNFKVPCDWSPDGKTILFQEIGGKRDGTSGCLHSPNVKRTFFFRRRLPRLSASSRRMVVGSCISPMNPANSRFIGTQYDVSADGKRFLINSPLEQKEIAL